MTGRHRKIKLENRTCSQCNNTENLVEDEFHFIVKCDKYSNKRKLLYQSITKNHDDFKNLSNEQKFIYIMYCRSNMTDIIKFIYENLIHR